LRYYRKKKHFASACFFLLIDEAGISCLMIDDFPHGAKSKQKQENSAENSEAFKQFLHFA